MSAVKFETKFTVCLGWIHVVIKKSNPHIADCVQLAGIVVIFTGLCWTIKTTKLVFWDELPLDHFRALIPSEESLTNTHVVHLFQFYWLSHIYIIAAIRKAHLQQINLTIRQSRRNDLVQTHTAGNKTSFYNWFCFVKISALIWTKKIVRLSWSSHNKLETVMNNFEETLKKYACVSVSCFPIQVPSVWT